MAVNTDNNVLTTTQANVQKQYRVAGNSIFDLSDALQIQEQSNANKTSEIALSTRAFEAQLWDKLGYNGKPNSISLNDLRTISEKAEQHIFKEARDHLNAVGIYSFVGMNLQKTAVNHIGIIAPNQDDMITRAESALNNLATLQAYDQLQIAQPISEYLTRVQLQSRDFTAYQQLPPERLAAIALTHERFEETSSQAPLTVLYELSGAEQFSVALF